MNMYIKQLHGFIRSLEYIMYNAGDKLGTKYTYFASVLNVIKSGFLTCEILAVAETIKHSPLIL